MLRSMSELIGYTVSCNDGAIGKLFDFFFDDEFGELRYLVVDVGDWLPGRKIFLYINELSTPDWNSKSFPGYFTKQEVENCPHLDSQYQLTRNDEKELFRHFKWNPYWNDSKDESSSTVESMQHSNLAADSLSSNNEFGTLRSFRQAMECGIEAEDGILGHLSDMILNDENWQIVFLVADAKNVNPGKNIILAWQWLKYFDWIYLTIHMEIRKDKIRQHSLLHSNQSQKRQNKTHSYSNK